MATNSNAAQGGPVKEQSAQSQKSTTAYVPHLYPRSNSQASNSVQTHPRVTQLASEQSSIREAAQEPKDPESYALAHSNDYSLRATSTSRDPQLVATDSTATSFKSLASLEKRLQRRRSSGPLPTVSTVLDAGRPAPFETFAPRPLFSHSPAVTPSTQSHGTASPSESDRSWHVTEESSRAESNPSTPIRTSVIDSLARVRERKAELEREKAQLEKLELQLQGEAVEQTVLHYLDISRLDRLESVRRNVSQRNSSNLLGPSESFLPLLETGENTSSSLPRSTESSRDTVAARGASKSFYHLADRERIPPAIPTYRLSISSRAGSRSRSSTLTQELFVSSENSPYRLSDRQVAAYISSHARDSQYGASAAVAAEEPWCATSRSVTPTGKHGLRQSYQSNGPASSACVRSCARQHYYSSSVVSSSTSLCSTRSSVVVTGVARSAPRLARGACKRVYISPSRACSADATAMIDFAAYREQDTCGIRDVEDKEGYMSSFCWGNLEQDADHLDDLGDLPNTGALSSTIRTSTEPKILLTSQPLSVRNADRLPTSRPPVSQQNPNSDESTKLLATQVKTDVIADEHSPSFSPPKKAVRKRLTPLRNFKKPASRHDSILATDSQAQDITPQPKRALRKLLRSFTPTTVKQRYFSAPAIVSQAEQTDSTAGIEDKSRKHVSLSPRAQPSSHFWRIRDAVKEELDRRKTLSLSPAESTSEQDGTVVKLRQSEPLSFPTWTSLPSRSGDAQGIGHANVEAQSYYNIDKGTVPLTRATIESTIPEYPMHLYEDSMARSYNRRKYSSAISTTGHRRRGPTPLLRGQGSNRRPRHMHSRYSSNSTSWCSFGSGPSLRFTIPPPG